MPLKPTDIILQELALFAASHGLDGLGVGDIRDAARRLYDRLHDNLLGHREAAELLGVSPDTLHSYRRQGLIHAVLKSPHKKTLRKHYLYRRMDVLELRTTRSGPQRRS